MAFRIPIRFLSDEQKNRIVADLHIVETEKKWLRSFGKQGKGKSIDFYIMDTVKNEVALPYNYACTLLNQPHLNRRRTYHQVKPWTWKPEFSLYDYQKEVIAIAHRHYSQRGSAFINVFCAFGKTVVGAHSCHKFSESNGLLSLILHPRNILGKSWSGTFETHTNAKIHVVGLGPGPEVIPDDTQVIICSDTRIKRIPQEVISRVGHLVLDEAHIFCSISHVEGILSVEPLTITLLTATYERPDGMHVMLDYISGHERITRISKKPFFVLKFPTPFVPLEVKTTRFGIQYDSLVAELDKIDERNLLICNLAVINANEKVLVLTYHVQHAYRLASWLYMMCAPHGKRVSLLAGDIESYYDADILVGTRSKIGVGFDEKEVAINWDGRRLKVLIGSQLGQQIEQLAGRAFRAPYSCYH